MTKKTLGLPMLIALVAGNMIGSGVFLLPANLAEIGSISLFSWLFTTAGALLLAVVFSHLSVRFPKAGGPYAFAKLGLGSFMGFQTAYCYWLAILAGNAALAIAFAGYLQVFVPVLRQGNLSSLCAIVAIWFFTLINCKGVRSAGYAQLLTTILKLIPLLAVAFLGWQAIHWHYYTDSFNVTIPQQSNLKAIFSGATLTFWAFLGLESATVPADSVDNAHRNIPRATLYGTLLAASVYIVCSFVMIGMLPVTILQSSNSPFADAAQLLMGTAGRYFIAVGAIISSLGALNGWILMQGQVARAVADDGLFPGVFARLNKDHVPAHGMIISSLIITGLLLLTMSQRLIQQFQLIILLAVLASLVPYFYTMIAELLLIKRGQYGAVKWYYYLAVMAAALFSIWMICSLDRQTLFYGLLVLLSSFPFYVYCSRKGR
ncbi:MAG: arginine/agmatine antiporter [Gammaproteobacteria bacterium]|nr:arginine/agmatine antiporter [Gammaproteobacteria bacterium]